MDRTEVSDLVTGVSPKTRAIPVLPAGDWEESVAFWRKLGFEVEGPHHDYARARRGDLEVHLYADTGIECFTNHSACYLRVQDAAALRAEWQAAGVLPLAAVEDKPWGMREFHVVDPAGNLVRVGQLI
jgi:catechol 2,3-dioxygenase-like lactoylglutathione lyase family enzyme